MLDLSFFMLKMRSATHSSKTNLSIDSKHTEKTWKSKTLQSFRSQCSHSSQVRQVTEEPHWNWPPPHDSPQQLGRTSRRNHSANDPRSFDTDKVLQLFYSFKQSASIEVHFCLVPGSVSGLETMSFGKLWLHRKQMWDASGLKSQRIDEFGRHEPNSLSGSLFH